jgi:hypothetical protein
MSVRSWVYALEARRIRAGRLLYCVESSWGGEPTLGKIQDWLQLDEADSGFQLLIDERIAAVISSHTFSSEPRILLNFPYTTLFFLSFRDVFCFINPDYRLIQFPLPQLHRALKKNWLKKTPWSESASELYRPSDRRLSTKWLSTFADRRCHVVSVTDPYGRILGFLDKEKLTHQQYIQHVHKTCMQQN